MKFIKRKTLWPIAVVVLVSVITLGHEFYTIFAENSQQIASVPLDFTQQARLATDIAGDAFPSEVALSGSTAVALSDAGAHVYVRAGSTWSLQTTLVPSDGIGVFAVGAQRVAISGDTVVLGARNASINGNASGAAYVFVRTGTSWNEQQRLTASDGAASDTFGSVVDISGNTIIVGAPQNDVGANVDEGTAYVFVRSGSIWTEQQILHAADADHHNYLGHRVRIDGDTAVVSRARSTQATVVDPAVYVFVRNGTVWQQEKRLSVCEQSSLNLCWFGGSIAVKDNLLAVGNIFLNEGTSTSVGGAYVFERSAGNWKQSQKLLPDVILTNSLYGRSLATDGELLIVGAEGDFVDGSAGVPGAAYVYTRPSADWVQQQKLQVPGVNYWNSFGFGVSLSDNTLLVSALRDNGQSPYVGAAYVYTQPSAPNRTRFDYDGDGKTDVSVFRPSTNEWHILQSGGEIRVQGWGLANDKPGPADFDGDGKTDLAVFRPNEGNWYILNSSNNTVTGAGWGVLNDLPVPADYNGDNKADLVVYRPSNRNWYRRDSDGLIHVFEWGLADDRPAPADFTGDGRTDMVVFRPSEGKWYVLSSSDFSVTTTEWGVSGDVPVAADYSGDGKADFVVFRPSDLTWYRRNTDDGTLHFITWGLTGDIPVPGDYDGDGKTDLAVYRPSNGTWYVFGSSAGIYSQPFGLAADLPTPNAFIY